MNSINASTGFSNFQLHLGHSPWLIPPIVPADLPEDFRSAALVAEDLITQIRTNVMEAKDNLFQAKISQEHHVNTHCGDEFVYQVGNKVMLSAFNWCNEYCKKGENQAP